MTDKLPGQVSVVSPLGKSLDGSRRRRRRQRPSRSEPVEVVRVDARIMKTALRIAEGDASRLTIISATKVEIR